MTSKIYTVRYTRFTRCQENVSVDIPEADIEKLKGMTDDERAQYLTDSYWRMVEEGTSNEFYDPTVEEEWVEDELEGPHNFSLVEWIDGKSERETALPNKELGL